MPEAGGQQAVARLSDSRVEASRDRLGSTRSLWHMRRAANPDLLQLPSAGPGPGAQVSQATRFKNAMTSCNSVTLIVWWIG